MSFTPPRPGIACKNGKLYVFSARRISVLKGWPEMAAWTRSKRQPHWSRFRPVLNIAANTVSDVRSKHRFHPALPWPPCAEEAIQFNPEDIQFNPEDAEPAPFPRDPVEEERREEDNRRWDERKRLEQALTADFIAKIPEEVRAAASQFPTRHWHLLSTAARCGSAIEILRDNPALGFAMASCWVFCDVQSAQAMRWIRRMIPRRRRDIAAALGFPEREAAIRVLGKLGPGACCVRHLLSLRGLLADPNAMKLLAHFAVVDAPVIALMDHPRLRASVHERFVAQLGAELPLPVAREMIPGMLHDFYRMCEQLGQPERALRQFRSVESFIAAHDEAAHRVIDTVFIAKPRFVFPLPPLPGTATIVPIASVDELLTEAREQQNCVASLAQSIAAGAYYAYRLLSPERATVGLRRMRQTWVLDQVAAARNAPVTEASRAALAAWIGIDAPF